MTIGQFKSKLFLLEKLKFEYSKYERLGYIIHSSTVFIEFFKGLLDTRVCSRELEQGIIAFYSQFIGKIVY